MYMGQSHCVFHRDGWEQLRLYKQIDTHRYLNVAEDGTCFRFSEGWYAPISTEEAFAHVFRKGRGRRRRNTMAKTVNKVILLGMSAKILRLARRRVERQRRTSRWLRVSDTRTGAGNGRNARSGTT
jgi:hypothetical protein